MLCREPYREYLVSHLKCWYQKREEKRKEKFKMRGNIKNASETMHSVIRPLRIDYCDAGPLCGAPKKLTHLF